LLKEIPKLPNSLKVLHAIYNVNLHIIHNLPTNIKELKIHDCRKINKLPLFINHDIPYLNLINTNVCELPVLLNQTTSGIGIDNTPLYDFIHNNIMKKYDMKTKFEKIWQEKAQKYIQAYPCISQFSLDYYRHTILNDLDKELLSIYIEWNNNRYKKFVRKIENWFLECKYNPKYKYCQKRLKLEFDEMYEEGGHKGFQPLPPLKPP